MIHSFTVVRVYLDTYVKRKNMDPPFVNKDIFGD